MKKFLITLSIIFCAAFSLYGQENALLNEEILFFENTFPDAKNLNAKTLNFTEMKYRD